MISNFNINKKDIFMRIYISGAISSDMENYKNKFKNAKEHLERQGHTVVNPVEVSENLQQRLRREPTYAEYMRNDLAALFTCEAIYMLSDWKTSPGARLEHCIAVTLAMIVIYQK